MDRNRKLDDNKMELHMYARQSIPRKTMQTFKRVNKINGRKKQLLREFVNYICEECGTHEDKCGLLHPHRIRRGYQGGQYELRNIKMVCDNCHKIIHGKEFK